MLMCLSLPYLVLNLNRVYVISLFLCNYFYSDEYVYWAHFLYFLQVGESLTTHPKQKNFIVISKLVLPGSNSYHLLHNSFVRTLIIADLYLESLPPAIKWLFSYFLITELTLVRRRNQEHAGTIKMEVRRSKCALT